MFIATIFYNELHQRSIPPLPLPPHNPVPPSLVSLIRVLMMSWWNLSACSSLGGISLPARHLVESPCLLVTRWNLPACSSLGGISLPARHLVESPCLLVTDVTKVFRGRLTVQIMNLHARGAGICTYARQRCWHLHARTHTRTHVRIHARIHAHKHTRTHIPICGKIFEKIIFNNLDSYFNANYRPGDSTSNQLLYLVNEIHEAFENPKSLEVPAVFLDISKAFD